MNDSPHTSDDIFRDFADRLDRLVEKHPPDSDAFVADAQDVFRNVLAHRQLFGAFFVRLATDNDFLRSQLAVMQPNEYVFHYHPKGAFSIRLYVWDDFVYSYIHDHGSWGIYGACVNPTRSITYRRLDDASDREYAELEIDRTFTLNPGDLSLVHPFDAGIHMVGAVRGISITLNVYGPTHRRGYINRFDPEKKRVTRIFTPRLEKRLLAVRSLGEIGHQIARDTLEQSASDDYPMVRWESIASMERIDPDHHVAMLRHALNDPSRRLRARARRELDRRGLN